MTRADLGAQRVRSWRKAQQKIRKSADPHLVELSSTDSSLQGANAGSSSPVSSGNRNYDEQLAAEDSANETTAVRVAPKLLGKKRRYNHTEVSSTPGVCGFPSTRNTCPAIQCASACKELCAQLESSVAEARAWKNRLKEQLREAEEREAALQKQLHARRTNADRLLAANASPLLGTWEYACGKKKRKYYITASETGAVVYREQSHSIRLHHRTDADYISQTRGDELSQPPFLADWGGATADGVAIFFALQGDGSLRSSYCKLGYSPYETTAVRVALENAL